MPGNQKGKTTMTTTKTKTPTRPVPQATQSRTIAAPARQVGKTTQNTMAQREHLAKPAKSAAPVPKDRAPVPQPGKKRAPRAVAPAQQEVVLDEAEIVDEFSAADAGNYEAPAEENFEESMDEESFEGSAEDAIEAEAEVSEEETASEPEQDEFVEAEVEEAPAPAPAKKAPATKAPAPRAAQPASKATAPAQAAKPTAPKMQPPVQKPAAPKAPTQALTTQKPAGALAVAQPTVKSNALQGDLTIPRVLLLQQMSELVKQRKGFPGQIVTSPEGRVLGGINHPGEPSTYFNVIPLAMSTSWTIMAKEGNRWIGTEPRTVENDSLPWEFTNEEGEDCKRIKTVDLIALLESDVAGEATGSVEVDEDGVPIDLDAAVVMPKAFSFRSTSFVAGKAVSTFFAKVQSASAQHPNTRPWRFMLPIGCIEDSNEHGDFYVFDVGGTQKTPKEYHEIAAKWYEQVQRSSVKIEDEAVAESQASENIQARPAKGGKAHF